MAQLLVFANQLVDEALTISKGSEDPVTAPAGCRQYRNAATYLALGTSFSYQGQLTEAGQPASGLYDLQVCLFDSVRQRRTCRQPRRGIGLHRLVLQV